MVYLLEEAGIPSGPAASLFLRSLILWLLRGRTEATQDSALLFDKRAAHWTLQDGMNSVEIRTALMVL